MESLDIKEVYVHAKLTKTMKVNGIWLSTGGIIYFAWAFFFG